MPKAKKQSMFDVEVTSTPREKLPTIRQFVKGLPNDVENHKSRVCLIWLPGQWRNYTLQTNDYRAIVDEKNTLFDLLASELNDFTKGDKTFTIEITKRKPLAYSLRECTEVSGEWFFIGEGAGLRFEEDVPMEF
jgi:hypothetical protein